MGRVRNIFRTIDFFMWFIPYVIYAWIVGKLGRR